ncbi:MAG: isoaspartyl peptidase/L-asparaginase [Actinomycetota bacterium]
MASRGTIVCVHGGVGTKPPAERWLGYAVNIGRAEHRALDAVEAAVRALEDDPHLNAGYGSVLNAAGELELDAAIADGVTGQFGAVAGVRVRNPISLARKVLHETPHVLLAGAGAMALASREDILRETTPNQRGRWLRAQAEAKLDPSAYAEEGGDTVGAIALDASGALAAGSSTGGVFAKMPGRIGDCPVFGAGIYADARVAVVGTGVGEVFLETLACLRVAGLVQAGAHPQRACSHVVQQLQRRRRLPAGLLALDAEGRVGAAFHGKAWTVEGRGGPVHATRLDGEPDASAPDR